MIDVKIKEVLDKIRPMLQSDGGDVEFIKYDNGTVYVKLLGKCLECNLIDNTLEDMILTSLSFEIPEVIRVINMD